MTQVIPEQYNLSPTAHAPNSKLPVLVYRNAIQNATQADAAATVQANRWLKGGQWHGYPVAHFHSNTHECYVILGGTATYELGRSPVDPPGDIDDSQTAGGGSSRREGEDCRNWRTSGMKLRVRRGDVLVLPAGVAHASVEYDGAYEFAGFYPEGSPPWDMNYAKELLDETSEKVAACKSVPLPAHDPVYGLDGPLSRMWRAGTSK